MKLLMLELRNFRQFYGDQKVEFAPGSRGKENITVFHGFNGAGKTALLNAFIWCLYGELTPDLEHPERLVNERALAEATIGTDVGCRAALEFEFRGEKYRAERIADVRKIGATETTPVKPELELIMTSRVGEIVSIGKDERVRQQRIEQILPRSLYRFFFFNGERVEQLARANAYENIESGVKTLLDIEIYERGTEHLRGPVIKALSDEVKRAGDDELSSVMDIMTRKNEELRSCEEIIAESQANIAALKENIAQLELRQEKVRTVAELVGRRKQLRSEIITFQGELSRENAGLATLISKSGYLAFGATALDVTDAQVSAARTRGDLPAKIKPQFVDDLLYSGKCICGRPVHAHSEEAHALTRYKSLTGLADVETNIATVSAEVRNYRERRQDLFLRCDEALRKIASLRNELREREESLSAIDVTFLEGSFGDEAEQLKSTIQERNQEIVHQIVAISQKEKLKAQLDQEIVDLRKICAGLKARSEKGQLAHRQLVAVQNVADALAAIRDIQKEDVRSALDTQVRAIWSDAAIKDYTASVSSKYELVLTKSVAGVLRPVTGASTGEKQVLALSFVGAMVRKARENVSRRLSVDQAEVEGGGFYPLVMDSPFGSLEDEYRRKVATWLPNLAEQVVVMASKSQWRNEVESAMRERIGAEYILELHSSKRGVEHSIILAGVDYPYVVSGEDEVEMTIIRRVR